MWSTDQTLMNSAVEPLRSLAFLGSTRMVRWSPEARSSSMSAVFSVRSMGFSFLSCAVCPRDAPLAARLVSTVVFSVGLLRGHRLFYRRHVHAVIVSDSWDGSPVVSRSRLRSGRLSAILRLGSHLPLLGAPACWRPTSVSRRVGGSFFVLRILSAWCLVSSRRLSSLLGVVCRLMACAWHMRRGSVGVLYSVSGSSFPLPGTPACRRPTPSYLRSRDVPC